ncbi:hypothetical protein [Sphingomonas sp. M1-B02]|uniref:hypothetical protein n=1 Tax=Sphingomonas sp. M1-B02 TaxID=3114300 RepID=UPI00223F4858|nr:hypothetical protein [Sphingomonas sp. S6-11]UZK66196.1 hypothetical protein OKW87_17095 [Sphingomonas sp. S6-11]
MALAAALLASPASSMPLLQPQSAVPTLTDDEIVVIGRKLRRALVAYSARGNRLGKCIVERSSGDNKVDRMLCDMVASCIRDGNRQRLLAEICLNARIEAFEARVPSRR